MWGSLIKEWWLYQRQMAACRKAEAKALANIPQNGDPTNGLWVQDVEKNDQWRRLILTRFLRFQADRLGVDLPSTTEQAMYGQVEWDDDESQPYYLTDVGVQLTRDRIRAEKKHRREVAAFWVTSVVGVLGAITGMISVWKS
jgi:hypothetical protein